MDPLAEKDIRDCFVNCSKGEARRLDLPRGLAEVPWEDLDFLGWRDPGAPERAYLVAERDGAPVGVTLRVPPGVRRSLVRTTVCSICLTGHVASGVCLRTARRAGAAGRRGNTVGSYMCADLACSLYVRGRKKSKLVVRADETLSPAEQAARLRSNLALFLDRVLDENESAASG
jgi:hypothetical protein